LLAEFVAAYSSPVLVALDDGYNLIALRLRCWLCELAEFVVSRSAGVLLHDYWQGLHHSTDHSVPRDTATYITSNTLRDAAAIDAAATNTATTHPATSHATASY